MRTLNSNWLAALSVSGVEPVVHVKILDLSTFTLSGSTVTSGSAEITVSSTEKLEEGMTVSGTGIPTFSYIVSVNEPTTVGGTSTKITISTSATSTSTTTLTFGKVYQMITNNHNHRSLTDRFFADPIIVNIVPVSSTMDHWKREPQVGELSIEIMDEGLIRNIGKSSYGGIILKRKKVEVRVGAPELDFSDYEKVFFGEIHEMIPSESIVTLTIRDHLQSIFDGTFKSIWFGEHPLKVIRDSMINAGIVADNIDTNSFDPDHSSNADISHYCITAITPVFGKQWEKVMTMDYDPGVDWKPGFGTQVENSDNFPNTNGTRVVPLKPLISELSRSLHGILIVSPDGTIRIKRFIPSNAVETHFTINDYADFEQMANEGNVVNKVIFEIGVDDVEREFTLESPYSITAYGIQEVKAGKHLYSATMTYADLNPLVNETFTTTTDEVSVFMGQTNGLTGTRGAHLSTPPPAAAVNSSRPLYLLNQTEIIKCTSVTADTSVTYGLPIFDDDGFPIFGSGGGITTEKLICRADLDNLTRGYRDTTEATIKTIDLEWLDDPTLAFEYASSRTAPIPEWSITPFWDITQMFDWGVTVLNRYQDGLPFIQFTAPLIHFGLELGDFISIDNDSFFHRTTVGSNSTVKWEILGKEASFFGDSVGIRFTCAFVSGNVLDPDGVGCNSTSDIFHKGSPYTNPIIDSSAIGVVTDNSVLDGLYITGVSGSGNEGKAIISVGTYNQGGMPTSLTHPVLLDGFGSNKEVYVSITQNGYPSATELSVGSSLPHTGPNEVRLARVRTDTSGNVFHIYDMREFGGVTSRGISNLSNFDSSGIANSGFNTWGFGPTQPPDSWHFNETSGKFSDKWEQTLDRDSGQYALKSKANATTSTAADLVSSLISVEPGVKYIASISAKSPSSDETFRLHIDQYNSPDSARLATTDINNGSASSVGGTDWKKHQDQFTVSANVKFARLRITRDVAAGSVGDNYILFDRAGLIKAPVLSEMSEVWGAGGTEVPISQGGTGESVRQDAINSLTDSGGSGYTGKVLTVVGGNAAWSSVGSGSLTGLSDTDIDSGSLAAGQILKWDGNTWDNENLELSITGLSDTDINSGSLASGQVLKWDGNTWDNENLDVPINQGGTGQSTRQNAINALTDSGGGGYTGKVLTVVSGNAAWSSVSVAGLSDTDIDSGSLTTGQVLAWDGNTWDNTDASGAKVTASTTVPSGPEVGDQWYRTDINILFTYIEDAATNKAWVDQSTSLGIGGPIIISSTTAPTSPSPGDMWYRTDTNMLFVNLMDAASNQAWFDISSTVK